MKIMYNNNIYLQWYLGFNINLFNQSIMETEQLQYYPLSKNDPYAEKQEEKPIKYAELWFSTENQEQLSSSDQDDEVHNQNSELVSVGNSKKEQQEKEQIQITNEFHQKNKQRRHKVWNSYEHFIDIHYLCLLIELKKCHLIDIDSISKLKEGFIDLQTKPDRIIIKTTSQQQSNKAIQNISNYLNKLQIKDIQLQGEKTRLLLNFKKLKEYLRNKKIVMFAARSTYNLFLGGQMKSKQLGKTFEEIRVQKVHLRAIRNTRSYKIIIGQILNMKTEFGKDNFVQIWQQNKSKELIISLGTKSKSDLFNNYQRKFMDQLRNYYVLTFCCSILQIFFEKPQIENVALRIIKDKNIKKSYVYIIAKKQDFITRREEIYNFITKIGEKILGVRFFYYLNPSAYEFLFDRTKNYFFRFPSSKPYSLTFAAKTSEGYSFDWQTFFQRFMEIIDNTK